MTEVDGRPLHEKVFQLKAAIRRAGFVASGRVRMEHGKVVMGVIVPVAFPAGDLTVEQVKTALCARVGEVCYDGRELTDGMRRVSMEADIAGRSGRRTAILSRPPDLRTAAGRAWKAEQAAGATT
jgi:hypothetical protein